MRNQLRPGGLAIITGCAGGKGLVVNIGKVVDVVKFIPMDTPFTVNGKVGMHSVAAGLWLVRCESLILPEGAPPSHRAKLPFALAFASSLTPINPDDLPVETRDRELEGCY